MKHTATLTKFLLAALLLISAHYAVAAKGKQYLLTEKTYKSLAIVQKLMDKPQYGKAETRLKSLLKQTPASSYDRAVVEQTLGYLYAAQDQYKAATQAFQRALDAHALPAKVVHKLQYNQAQLLIGSERYQSGIALMEKWLSTEKSPPDSVYVMLSSAYYRLQNYPKVIKNIHTLIQRNRSPKQSWYRLLLSAHLQLKQYKSAIKVLETLITQYPHKQVYWDQLAALYQQQTVEFSSLAVRVLAEKLDLADSKTLISLADMYRYLQIPYKSAQLIKQGLKEGLLTANFADLQRLADSWLAAREPARAAPVLERMIKLDSSGATDLKLGRVYLSMEKWPEAVSVLSNSMDKLEGKPVGAASLLLGMAYFHQGSLERAKAYFTKAVAYKNEHNQAGQWLRHINNLITEKTDAT